MQAFAQILKSQRWTLIPKSSEKPKYEDTNNKLVEVQLRSIHPRLWKTLALHKFPPKVAILVGRCDQPLKRRGTWAIRAPCHHHCTISRPGEVGGWRGARHLSPVLTAWSPEKKRKKRGGREGCNSRTMDRVGMPPATVLYELDKLWVPLCEVDTRWVPWLEDT
jgi:hypothetical protein